MNLVNLLEGKNSLSQTILTSFNSYVAHLPWVIPHLPETTRTFTEKNVVSAGPVIWFLECISSFDFTFLSSEQEKLYQLGVHVENVGRFSKNKFESFVRAAVLRKMSGLVAFCEEKLETQTETLPAYYVADVKEYIKVVRRDAQVPFEELYGVAGGRETLQKLIVQYGQILKNWSFLVETARDLKAEGYQLAELL